MDLSPKAVSKLAQLHRKAGGELHARDVLDEARNAKSPLHSYFTWDDGEAAERFRLIEAGRLIVRVRVEITRKELPPVRVAAYQCVGPDDKGRAVYRSTHDVLTDEQLRAQLLSTALRELQAFEKRYRDLVELSEVFQAIHAVAA